MKIIYIAVILLLFAKPKADVCPCAKPIKETVNWCKGPKGGLYCLTIDGKKRYKPKTK